MSSFHYARGLSKSDNQPIPKMAENFADFAQAVLSDRAPVKGMVYVCAPMANDGRRSRDNAMPRQWLPFDVDGIADGEALDELLSWFQGLQGFAYTTSSHTPENPRCRVVVALQRPVDPCRRGPAWECHGGGHCGDTGRRSYRVR